jgi:SAM-dependent methyltransferase
VTARPADRDAADAPAPQFFNRTRRSRSIPLTLLTRGRVLEVPLYFALRLSDLGREGIENSGSYRFADHIYRNQPSGRGWIGRWIDARLLAMPAARSFRNRYLAAGETLAGCLLARRGQPLDVLSVPCGLPRDLALGARLARTRQPSALRMVTFHGLDLDADVLARATAFAAEAGLPNFSTHHGDALARAAYPASVDFISCTGFGEFLDDRRLDTLYGIFFDVLRPGGMLVTTGMRRYWASDYLLRLAELEPHYRSGAELDRLVRRLPFRSVDSRPDAVGLQTIVVAVK